jgi:hypothetical protein
MVKRMARHSGQVGFLYGVELLGAVLWGLGLVPAHVWIHLLPTTCPQCVCTFLSEKVKGHRQMGHVPKESPAGVVQYRTLKTFVL